MRVELAKEFRFEAAHRNTALPGDDPRARLHGHSYRVEIHVAGPIGEKTGWLVDYADIKRAFKPYLRQLDHHDLNTVEGLEDTTARGIETWIADYAGSAIPGFLRATVNIPGVKKLGVQPGPDQGYAKLSFAAAHSLPNVPPGHKCGRLHGHSYRVEATGSVESLRREMERVYPILAYSHLNTIAGLENSTAEMLAGWLWERWAGEVEDLEAITVAETCSARCVYRGEE